MRLRNIFLASLLSVLSVLYLAPVFISNNAEAQYVQPVQVSRKLDVSKKIKDPRSGQFTDNLYSNQYTFGMNNGVTFQVEIKNSGQEELKNIQVKDKMPDILDFISGPWTVDKGNMTLNLQIEKLSVGESVFREFTAKVKKVDGLGTQTPCYTNFAEANVNDLYGSDTSVFCIKEVKELPAAGPGHWYIVLGISTLAGATGLYLTQKAKKLKSLGAI